MARWMMEIDLLKKFRVTPEILAVDWEREANRTDGEEMA